MLAIEAKLLHNAVEEVVHGLRAAHKDRIRLACSVLADQLRREEAVLKALFLLVR